MGRDVFYSSEPLKTVLLYLAVGLAFLPWGALYAGLSLFGWDHWSVALLLLGGGFLTAHTVWTALETPSAAIESKPHVYNLTAIFSLIFAFAVVIASFAMAIYGQREIAATQDALKNLTQATKMQHTALERKLNFLQLQLVVQSLPRELPSPDEPRLKGPVFIGSVEAIDLEKREIKIQDIDGQKAIHPIAPNAAARVYTATGEKLAVVPLSIIKPGALVALGYIETPEQPTFDKGINFIALLGKSGKAG
jgi:hypothetical protein